MSTIVTSNISDGTNTVGTEYVVNGSEKAWVNFNGTGTIAVRDSFNVSSITDNGTGSYAISFTNSFSNANYKVSGAGGNDLVDSFTASIALGVLTTSSYPFGTGFVSTSSASRDNATVCQDVSGDLA